MPIWQGPDPLDVAPEVIFDLLLLPLLLEISSRFRFFPLLRELPAEQLVGPAFDFWQNSTWSEKFGEVEWVQGGERCEQLLRQCRLVQMRTHRTWNFLFAREKVFRKCKSYTAIITLKSWNHYNLVWRGRQIFQVFPCVIIGAAASIKVTKVEKLELELEEEYKNWS